LSQFTRVTDRQTDGRTDGRTEISSQYDMHYMQRGKNCSLALTLTLRDMMLSSSVKNISVS